MTMIVLASRIVDKRCAITKLVRPSINFSIPFCIRTSVRVSTEDVASSKIRILGSFRNALAIVNNCF